jgi:hypothetical protein
MDKKLKSWFTYELVEADLFVNDLKYKYTRDNIYVAAQNMVLSKNNPYSSIATLCKYRLWHS